jgi:formate-dependent nitrite reductase cytochrome c552 subunit
VSTTFSSAQRQIMQDMIDANAAGRKAQFKLAQSLTYEGITYQVGTDITLKEMSSVHTKLDINTIKLSRQIEVNN